MKEKKKIEKMRVCEMSKKIINCMMIVVIVLIITDIVRSEQKNTVSWTSRYMEYYASNIYQSFKKEDYNLFDENGFLFPNSDKKYLTNDDLYALKKVEDYKFKELLGFAKNEIYARHGLSFKKNGKYYKFYMKYDWYNKIKHKGAVEKDLNKYEKKNIKKIMSIKAKKGV